MALLLDRHSRLKTSRHVWQIPHPSAHRRIRIACCPWAHNHRKDQPFCMSNTTCCSVLVPRWATVLIDSLWFTNNLLLPKLLARSLHGFKIVLTTFVMTVVSPRLHYSI